MCTYASGLDISVDSCPDSCVCCVQFRADVFCGETRQGVSRRPGARHPRHHHQQHRLHRQALRLQRTHRARGVLRQLPAREPAVDEAAVVRDVVLVARRAQGAVPRARGVRLPYL
ncbi:hypothetical protein O3G_MSEX000336 [Manduca sexta]|nr:hypothetical protein O3G_MSEX000336 [Manduca sexta]